MKEVINDNFVVRDTLHEKVAVGNLRFHGEGMYITERQIDDLISALQEFKEKKKNG